MSIRMKASVYDRYGPPEVLELKEIERPVPAENEVLIKVHAASVNSWDYDLLRGKPRIYRLIFGFFHPRWNILGADVAGIVEKAGCRVSRFKPGDPVFGDLSGGNWGAFAEYVCAPEDALLLIPEGLSFRDASAIPQAGTLAMQGLLDKCSLQAGQKLLINGAGGGVGTFALQIAKSMGAEVTVIDRPEKFDMLRALGADHMIDYTREDFVKTGIKFDLVLDVIAHRSMLDYLKVLNPSGVYAMIGGKPGRIVQAIFVGAWLSLTSQKKMGLVAHMVNKHLEELILLWQAGKVKPILDSCYSLDQVPQAIRRLGEGKSLGKIVIRISE